MRGRGHGLLSSSVVMEECRMESSPGGEMAFVKYHDHYTRGVLESAQWIVDEGKLQRGERGTAIPTVDYLKGGV